MVYFRRIFYTTWGQALELALHESREGGLTRIGGRARPKELGESVALPLCYPEPELK